MSILKVSDDLYLIDLPQKLRGFRKFISSWVIKDGDKAIVIDVGPSSTIDKLIGALLEIGVRKVEFILLTHIHIDHAGGLGEFLKKFPSNVVVHDSGIKHLINPQKLWISAKRVLGELAEVYGEIRPVPWKYIYSRNIEFGGYEIETVETPGHAPHHQSYIYRDYMFIGELAGTYLSIDSDFYIRPATPPRFIYEVMDSSIDKMLQYKDMMICFAHYGYYRSSRKILSIAKKQLKLWVDTTMNILQQYEEENIEEIKRIIKDELLEKDRYFSKYHMLEEDIRVREDYFISNSLSGMIKYLKERGESA